MFIARKQITEGMALPVDKLNKTEKRIYDDEKISYMIPRVLDVYGWRGVECNHGWGDLIIRTLHQVADIDPEKRVRIALIKEKFGGMRIHLDYDYEKEGMTEAVWEITRKAESEAMHICERCASTENIETKKRGGWISTYCKTCNDLHDQIDSGEKASSEWELA
jgi:hypothetical protein